MGTNANKGSIDSLTNRHRPSTSSMAVLYLVMFQFAVLFISSWPFVAQAKMFADCSFGNANSAESQNMSATVIGKLAAHKHMSHSCVVKTDGLNHQNHFFQVKAKRNKESEGFLHVSAYEADESQLLGHFDVSKCEDDWSSLTLCPPRYQKEVQDKYLSVSGTPNLAFTVQLDSSPQEIKLNEPKTVELPTLPLETARVFQFIPTEDISDTQLDVSVTSESANVPAYLKVSRDCKDVKDNIDDVDYKGESLRLSFAKKGRITLSKVSVPPLTDSTSSWFIGIAIKNASGNTPFNATKKVTLELSKSFDYSYAKPIAILVIVSALLGVAVSIFATRYLSFKKESVFTTNDETELQNQVERGQYSLLNDSERVNLLSNQRLNTCRDVLLNWFRRGPKTYSYTTGIVGFVLMIGAGQFVFANWHLMKEEGDRDNCYYNDFCYRVSGYHDIPLNLMISNLVYMVHGLILAGSVLYMEAKRLDQCRKRDESYIPPKQAFSIGYAFAWALFFEGGFSLVYHLCPSKLTFQFDTAFMFVIAGLTVILLYNGIEMKKFSSNGSPKSPVGAGNFFLYLLVPLYIFNYLGTLRHSETRLSTPLEIFFFVVLTCWWLISSIWSGWKLFSISRIQAESRSCKIFWFVLGVSAPVFCFFYWKSNLPQAFLFACIAESVIASLGTAFCRGIKLECSWLFFFQVVYVLILGIIWGFALYYFVGKQTTDKVETPEKSRNLNHDCVWLGFFDYHDIWHILSSHGLLMTAYFFMFVSSE